MIERLAKYRWQYVMILPGAILLLLFSYIPMVGIQVAFKDFHIGSTMWSSEWVGLENFSFLQDEQFWIVVKNTIYIAILKFVFGFPAPIMLALLINEVKNNKYKRFVQSVSYLPHFFSWIVVAYILQSLLTLDGGLVNQLIEKLGEIQSFLGIYGVVPAHDRSERFMEGDWLEYDLVSGGNYND